MKNVRLQFEVSEEKSKEIDALMKSFGITTKKELLNNALTLLDWALEEKTSGHEIAAIDKVNKEFHTLRMPIFNNVTKKHNKAIKQD
ncbi:hypothetical protein [Oceanisphaera sp. IT1-181]|uniref:hypothetical protein n=1 Tax=Oceanisphaera sp. IT1-181 TaxID=3081199 RepID=UPI0029CA38C8|nr:hypothetical protein [Oceanisphaera sp. IT1-181]